MSAGRANSLHTQTLHPAERAEVTQRGCRTCPQAYSEVETAEDGKAGLSLPVPHPSPRALEPAPVGGPRRLGKVLCPQLQLLRRQVHCVREGAKPRQGFPACNRDPPACLATTCPTRSPVVPCQPCKEVWMLEAQRPALVIEALERPPPRCLVPGRP